MATSGSVNFSLAGDVIITAALRVLRVIDPGETAPAGDITTGRQALNLLIKRWAALKDLNLWLTQEAVLHLEYDEQSYLLGPSGDYCGVLADCNKTQLAAAGAAAAKALTVDANTNLAASDYVGVELDDGTLHWDVQDGAVAGTDDVTMTTGLASAAAADNWLFHFTSKITRPVEILEARIRDTDDNDEPVEIVTNREDFFKITDKTSRGETTHLWYDPLPVNGRLYTWPVADDVTKRIVFTMRRTIEDFDAAADDFDGPVEVVDALKWNLALTLAAEYGATVSELVVGMARETFADVERKYRERKNMRFHP